MPRNDDYWINLDAIVLDESIIANEWLQKLIDGGKLRAVDILALQAILYETDLLIKEARKNSQISR